MSVNFRGLALNGIMISTMGSPPPPPTRTGLLTALSVPTIGTNSQPIDITVSPDGKNIYTANSGSGTISQYSLNVTTGQLSSLSTASVSLPGNYPASIIISPDGLFAYCATDSNIYKLSRNTTDGSLTLLSGSTSIAYGEQIIISADGKNMYGVGNLWLTQYSRDIVTGTIAAIGTTINVGGTPHGVVLDNTGLFLYMSVAGQNNVYQFSRDITTGLLTALSTAYVSAPSAATIARMAISPDNKFLYLGDGGSSHIFQYSRNVSSGLLSSLSPNPNNTNIAGMGNLWLPADGQDIYGVNYSAQLGQVGIDTLTGLTTALVPSSVIASTSQSYSLTGSPDGNFVYAADYTNSLIRQYSRG